EYAPYPSLFYYPSGDVDDATKETIGPPDDYHPWYNPTNPYMPTVPLVSTVVWWPFTKVERCNFATFLQVTSGVAFGVMKAWGLDKKYPAWEIAAGAIAGATTVFKALFCK